MGDNSPSSLPGSVVPNSDNSTLVEPMDNNNEHLGGHEGHENNEQHAHHHGHTTHTPLSHSGHHHGHSTHTPLGHPPRNIHTPTTHSQSTHAHPHSHSSHNVHYDINNQPLLHPVPTAQKKGNKHHSVFFSAKLKQLLMERQHIQNKDPSTPRILLQEEVTVDMHFYNRERLDRKSTTNVDDIVTSPPDWATVAWIDVDGMNESVLKKLAYDFDLHPIAVEDVVEIQKRPKLDFFADVLFMITSIVSKSPLPSGKVSLVTEQVSFFLVGKTLITIQQGIPGDVWGAVRQTIEDQDSIIRNSDTGFLLYVLLAAIVDTCKPIIDELEDTLEDLEVAMMEYPSHRLNKMVYAVKRHQITLRSILFPTRKILQRILPEEAINTEMETSSFMPRHAGTMRLPTRFEGSHIFSSLTTTYFRDLFGVITHLCEQIEQQKEVASSLTSLHLNHEAQRQGTASYAIAIVSVFFLPLTFVAGVYGMNFVHMPELQWGKGYLFVWMVFIGIVLFEMFIFHQVGWIQFQISKRLANKFGLKRKAGTLPPKYYRSHSLITAETDSAMSEM